jgi:hypothetical protein
MVPKRLQNQKRALNKGVLMYQVIVIPDALALEGRRPRQESQQRQEEAAKPIAGKIPVQLFELGNRVLVSRCCFQWGLF